VQIVTDAAADLSPEDIRQWGIQVLPLYIQFPDAEVSSFDITPDDFYTRLKSIVPKVPTTSQPSVGSFLEMYDKVTQPDILSIHVSGGLSGTFSTSQMASRQVEGKSVTTVDTETLSCGQRFQVLAAAMALSKGWDVPKILTRLEAIRAETETIYTLETLEYLQRGGRIGRVQALAGSLLGIKPIIHVDHKDGKYSNLSRARSVSQAMTSMATHLSGLYGDQPVWVTIVHGQYADKAEAFGSMLKEKLNVGKFDGNRISPVLGVHTGPGIVGAGVVPLKHFEDLL
jgi:DegV family protein with EDD domain